MFNFENDHVDNLLGVTIVLCISEITSDELPLASELFSVTHA